METVSGRTGLCQDDGKGGLRLGIGGGRLIEGGKSVGRGMGLARRGVREEVEG